jgi:ferredoxin
MSKRISAGRRALAVDMIVCDGRGVCAELFPERIRLDDWGYPMIDTTPIDPDLVAHARRAVAACPVLALRLERVPPPPVGQARSVGSESPERTSMVIPAPRRRVRPDGASRR